MVVIQPSFLKKIRPIQVFLDFSDNSDMVIAINEESIERGDPMPDYSETLGGRLRKYRQRMKLTQKNLSIQMGFNSSETVSQIEKGKREVKAWEIAQLADILNVYVSDLLRDERPQKDPIVLWRQSPEDRKESQETTFLKYCKEYALVESLSDMKVSGRLPQKEVDPEDLSFAMADQLAVEIRNEFGLGSRPSEEIEKILQDVYGVKIWHMEMEEGSAASVIGPFGPAILMNANEAPWRRNFNFAHELFHLITWSSLSPTMLISDNKLWDRIEKLANAFASSLLLPGESLSLEFNKHLKQGKIAYTAIIGIARNFGVSTQALLYRLLNLKRISKPALDKAMEDPIFEEKDRSTMAHYWWEPLNPPERFVRLAYIAFQKGNLSRMRLSEMLDTSLIDLSKTFERYGLSDQEGYDAEMRAT